MSRCALFFPHAATRWRCFVYKGMRGDDRNGGLPPYGARRPTGAAGSRRDGVVRRRSVGMSMVDVRDWIPRHRFWCRHRGGAGLAGRLPGTMMSGPNGADSPAPPGSGPAIGRAAGGLPIATYRRRRSTPVPGGASSRAPTGARGAVRPSGRAPIYSGPVASANSRPSIYSRAAVAAAGGGRAGRPAVRSPGGPDRAGRQARDSGRTGGTRAARAGPRRRGASRRCRRGRQSIRWRATTSVDSWRVLFCIRGCLTLACQSAGRVTRAVKAVTVCHGRRASRRQVENGLSIWVADGRMWPAERMTHLFTG